MIKTVEEGLEVYKKTFEKLILRNETSHPFLCNPDDPDFHNLWGMEKLLKLTKEEKNNIRYEVREKLKQQGKI